MPILRVLPALRLGLGLTALALLATPGRHQAAAGPPTGDLAGAPGAVSGVVKERLAAGRYSYFRLQSADGADHWVVIADRQHRNAAHITVHGCRSRRDFVSRRLDRRFALLNFCSLATTQPPGGPT